MLLRYVPLPATGRMPTSWLVVAVDAIESECTRLRSTRFPATAAKLQ